MFSSLALEILWASEIGCVAIICSLLPLIIQTFNNKYYLGHCMSTEIFRLKIKIKPILIVCFVLNCLVLILGLMFGERANVVNILIVIINFIFLFTQVYLVMDVLRDQSSIEEAIRKEEIKILNSEAKQEQNKNDEKINKELKHEYIVKMVNYSHKDYNDVEEVIDFFCNPD